MASGSKRHTEVRAADSENQSPSHHRTQPRRNLIPTQPPRRATVLLQSVRPKEFQGLKMYKLTTPTDKLLHAANFSVFVGSVFGISLLLQGLNSTSTLSNPTVKTLS